MNWSWEVPPALIWWGLTVAAVVVLVAIGLELAELIDRWRGARR
ncbi:hypothetical protein SEA_PHRAPPUCCINO_139 [Mycobacterium phage Phrappuccino]|uniref:Uncharacterized protein n=1 Tax=Mycobacterium phage Phrappuccino TaxID=2591223 RepID=A0A514DDX3_9CAUD|nr:hypothetical protein KHQ87_gp139 [Mycobacterium phage Phrappuccino]QDH91814.1 hypothetical protein SEA_PHRAPPUCCINO_139 [Mycobacterium phage Phrappuccino]QIQ63256.1 hypothetical protein SEA_SETTECANDELA_139 [Mycobacterium phage Settecandela]